LASHPVVLGQTHSPDGPRGARAIFFHDDKAFHAAAHMDQALGGWLHPIAPAEETPEEENLPARVYSKVNEDHFARENVLKW
jgi:hypothetical protein